MKAARIRRVTVAWLRAYRVGWCEIHFDVLAEQPGNDLTHPDANTPKQHQQLTIILIHWFTTQALSKHRTSLRRSIPQDSLIL